jgi:aldose 1-epimerase
MMMHSLILAAMMVPAVSFAHASVTKASWGKAPSGEAVDLYTLKNAQLTVQVMTYGAHVVSIEAPDRFGKKADVVLDFDSIDGYTSEKNTTYNGAIVGRYGNRIAKGMFKLDGKEYQIPLNNGANALHGGPVGFDKKVWQAHEITNGVELTMVSPDGDMGFPGELTVHVRYTLENSSLRIAYSATTTKPTVINLTNHSYFNLAGNGQGTILGEKLTIKADRYTPVDAGLIPTGELAVVAGTPFDFTKATVIGERIDQANEQLTLAGGYDHNFVLNGPVGKDGLREAAVAMDTLSGRTLTVLTTEPGVQFYSGNFLDGTLTGRFGAKYVKHSGFCLETQHFPDAPNHPDFASTELLPGKTYHSVTVFRFGTKE